MRKIHGLEKLVEQQPARLNAQILAELLLTDLHQCRCSIYGTIGDDDRVLLAQLALLPGGIEYEMFDQRIDLVVAGPILRNDCVPLVYRLQGEQFALSGRCSMIARVCGVDLYLQRSYTGVVGDIARQKFAIPLKPLLQML
ncbi:hypothetical protein RO575_04955 [Methylomonas sp. MO1]|uniref:hypothetical protein n=1 Tax=Methylomonas sp. MO1 TaxID=3073619 RepID=UPI0028A562A1|nr:hypothetical protein [Methylomonas sp. MO1]MDT4288895.1 hypothetical protein [Methylomonas sp. MO1]